MQLVDAADFGRDRTLSTLLELKHRLLQAAPINEISTLTLRESQMSMAPVSRGDPVFISSQDASQMPPPAATQQRTWTRVNSGSRDVSREGDATTGADATNKPTQRHRHGSLFGRFKNRRTISGSSAVPRETDQDERGATTSPTSLPLPPLKNFDKPRGTSSYGEKPKWDYQEGEDNPFEIWGESSHQETRDALDVQPDSTAARPSTTNLPSSPNPSMSTLSSARSPVQRAISSVPVPQPNPQNDYLGFCKGAWALQNGDHKAMRKSKEFNDGWSSSAVYFLSCSNSKCAFAGHMNLDVIWTKVWKMKVKRGVVFRWPFLAKSHVCLGKVKDDQFMFQCLFCVFLGLQAPVIQGTDLYLNHIIEEHRGRVISDVVLYKTGCVNDRVCEDKEEFDINLYPLMPAEQTHLRKQSEVLSDDLLNVSAKHRTSTQDSMFSNEPWNEGLSEFNHSGGFGPAELDDNQLRGELSGD